MKFLQFTKRYEIVRNINIASYWRLNERTDKAHLSHQAMPRHTAVLTHFRLPYTVSEFYFIMLTHTFQLVDVRYWEKGVGEGERGFRIQLYLVFIYKQYNHLMNVMN